MATKVRVNIHNVGQFMGIKTPVYNFPMDYGTYVLLLEMGFNIEIAKPMAQKQEVKQEQTKPEGIPVIKVETPVVKEIKTEPTEENWMTKDVYTEEELAKFSKNDLIKILNYRGHYSSKTGARDALAPKYDDNKTIIIEKILKTNKM